MPSPLITYQFYDSELDQVLSLSNNTTYVPDWNIDSLANPGTYQLPEPLPPPASAPPAKNGGGKKSGAKKSSIKKSGAKKVDSSLF